MRYLSYMFTSMHRWLANVPIQEPIDRRNAPIMQILLFTVGVTLPLNWMRHLSSLRVPDEWLHVMGADMFVALTALVGVIAIRRGYLQEAVQAFIVVVLAGLLVGYLSLGFEKHMVDQTSQMLVLVVTGLVIGRRALWGVFLALMLIFIAGFFVDAATSERGPRTGALPFHFLPSVAFAYFVVTLVLDRCITALRHSLLEARQKQALLQEELAVRAQMQAQLEHAQKMDIAGRMASGVAHDFSNILSVIIGVSRERHRIDDPDSTDRMHALELARALDCIERTAERGASLARKLLDLGRSDRPHPVDFNLSEDLHALRPLLKQMLGPDVRIRADSLPSQVWVRADRAQLELAVLNLASNARDAMPNGGTFEIFAMHNGASVTLCFRDDGQGMPEEVATKAFDPFFTTKPAGSGSGLGLSMTKSFAASAGGSVQLISSPDSGTTVSIRLPVIDRVGTSPSTITPAQAVMT